MRGPGQGRELGENRGKEKLQATEEPSKCKGRSGREVWTVWAPTSSVLPHGGLEAGSSNSGRGH